MPSNLLKNTEVLNAKCPKETSVKKFHDGDGLYLWVFPDGRKYWRMRFWQDGKEKLLAFGVYPALSLKDARAKRDAVRQQLATGLDPSAERRAEKHQRRVAAANSFEAVALEWYEKNAPTWVSSHAVDVKRRLDGNLFPALGKRPIGKIEAPELLQAIRKVEARGSYDLAHRVLQVAGQIFRYGIATGRCTRNLSADLRGALTPHQKRHQAAVKPEELAPLLQAIAGYDSMGDQQTRIGLQLLTLTFVRTSELIGAEWTEFNLDKKLWTIPASRMKMRTEHVVPLSRQTLALLEELRPISSHSKYLFPGRNAAKTISKNTLLYALARIGYGGRQTGHGFRSIASTILNETGHFRGDVIERQLAHQERNAVRAAYNRSEYLPERTRMMQWWGDCLDQKRR
ncbi:MAG: integrase arm-type DNA-binding domain-containing protein [Acidobacteriaceae bacterium]